LFQIFFTELSNLKYILVFKSGFEHLKGEKLKKG